MMEFLRGLAPRRDGDSSWAAPVVPSRFSGMGPLAIERLASEASAIVTTDSARELVDTDERTASPALPADRATAGVEPPAARPVLPTVPPVHAYPEVHHHHHESAAVERVVTPVVTPASVQRSVTRSVTSAPAESASILRAETPAVTTRPSPAVAQQPPLLQAVRVQVPLSPAAVAGRKAAPATGRPVIHVTIDRIEVRAPGTTRPAARTSRGRATMPAVSLADYLRAPLKGGGVR